MYRDQDSYTKPMYTKLKARESSMLAEVPSAGAIWSVRCTPAAQSYVALTVLMPIVQCDQCSLPQRGAR